jgi:enoyl-CoA hydratase/carnithine racemase
MNIKRINTILKTTLSKDGIYSLTLNNPHNHNVLSEEMMSCLQSALDESIHNKEIKVLIISADGPTFSAGHDLKELTRARQNPDKGKSYFKKIMGQCSKLMQSIVKNPKPIIAEVNGVATAAGCQLVASCDLAYASKSSKFATPGVNIGLFCSTPMVAVSRNISNKHSMEMLLGGELISAEDAEKIGLINKMVKKSFLKKKTLSIAKKISKKSPLTLKIGKEAFYKQVSMTLSNAYEFTSNVMVENMLKLDAEEGIKAFIEKRKPKWQDK